MCGRFVRARSEETYSDLYEVGDISGLLPSYNVAPTNPVLAVRMENEKRTAVILRWGLIPSWAKDKKTPFINARADTLFDKPAFRAAAKRRRCLIVADGYFEWKALGPKTKQPYYYRLADGKPIAFAGVWETWLDKATPGSEPIQSCAIVTTDANELASQIHDRMPVILEGPAADAWLDPAVEDARSLAELLRPFRADALTVFPVSMRVNKAGEQGADLIEPIDLQT
jgi:putative SOS response-associated peptidase YedK